MSVELATAYVSLVATTRGLRESVDRELSGVPGQFDRTATKSGSGFSSKLGSVLKVGMAAGLGAAAGGLALLFKTGVSEQSDFLKGQAQLTAGVKSTGGAAGVSVKHMESLAGSIQGMSGQTDDSIVSAEQLLLTFTNIKNSGPNKIFDQATQAAADMAAKMGGDASSNAILLGKALNDPVKGITALTRVGVSFTAGQKASIAAMVKTGDVAGAQKIILGELNTEFGGSAKAAGDTLPGQLTRLKRTFEDTAQGVIAGMMPVLTKLVSFLTGTVMPAFQQLVAWVQAHWPQIQAAILSAWASIKPTFDALVRVLKNDILPAGVAVVKFFLDGSPAAKAIAIAIGVLGAAFLVYSATMKVVRTATAAWAVVQAVMNAVMTANPIGLVVVAIAALVAGVILAYKNSETFRNIVQTAFSVVSTAASAMWNVLKTAFKFIVDTFLNVAGMIIHTAATAFGWIPGIGGKLKDAATAFDKFKTDVNNKLDGVDTKKAANKVTGLQTQVNSLKQGTLPKINADILGATAKATAIQLQINAIKQGKVPGLDANSEAGKAKIATLTTQMNTLKQTVIPQLQVDKTAASNKVADLQGEINGLRDKTVTVTVAAKGQAGANVFVGGVLIAGTISSNAQGGRVQAGVPTIVGDAGRPELFVPDVNGTILPRVPTGVGGGGGGQQTVNVYPQPRQSEYEIGVIAARELAWAARTA